jgi:hypothetical protein
MAVLLTPRREKGKIWSHIRKKLLNETPEEMVRQEYLCVLMNEYGFSQRIETIIEILSLGGMYRTRSEFKGNALQEVGRWNFRCCAIGPSSKLHTH